MSRRNGFRPAQQDIQYVAGQADPLELRRNIGWKAALCRLTATVSVDTADAGATVHPDGVARLVAEMLLKHGNREVHKLTGQDYRHLASRLAAQALAYDDDGLDLTSTGSHDLELEFIVPATVPWAARGSLDTRIAGVGVGTTFQLQTEFADAAASGGTSDNGTEALVESGSPELTWTTEPVIEVVEELDAAGDPLPVYAPQTTVHQSNLFDTAQDDLLVRIDTSKPVMAALIQVYDDANTKQVPTDLVDEVSFFGIPDWSEIPWEVLQMRERRDFPGVSDPDAGVVGVLLARGGKHSARFQASDYQERAIRFNIATAPSTQGRVRVILFHPIRKNVGVEVRQDYAPAGAGQGRGGGG